MTALETLEPARVQEWLDLVRRTKGSSLFFDVHVHPFDVIFQSLRYQRQAAQAGVYGTDGSVFVSPSLAPVPLDGSSRPPASYRASFYLLVVRKLYRHVGPRVLGEQLALAAVDRALLLPVAPAGGSDEWQLDALQEMFGNDPRFVMAVSVPSDVPDREIAAYVSRAVAHRRVRAVKLHPAITGIDVGSAPGRARVEAILDACRASAVPLIVHGGRSYPIQDAQAEGYAAIGNLAGIRWSDAKVPVCIAHAGCFASSLDEVERMILPALDSMLASNPNLVVDVSALELDSLTRVLERVDAGRVMFGSDALYQPSWVAMVKLLVALERARMDVVATLERVASRNPSRFLSMERVSC